MEKITAPVSSDKKIRAVSIVIAAVLITVALAGLYLQFAWNRYHQLAESQALQLAQSAADLLPVNHIATLSQDLEDPETSEYKFVKESLVKLVENNKSVYYAYIVYEKDGEFFSLAD